jgi:hypothetical protein
VHPQPSQPEPTAIELEAATIIDNALIDMRSVLSTAIDAMPADSPLLTVLWKRTRLLWDRSHTEQVCSKLGIDPSRVPR